MTIKSNGGVFGRNPTFNNVNVDGKLTGGDLRGDSLGIGVGSLSYGAEFAKAGAASYLMVNTTGATPSGLLIGAEGAKNSIYSGTGPGNLAGKPFFLYQGFTHVCNTTATGNLAFPSGQGIDFSATAGTGTSELFDDYEEGTWTPTLVTGTVTATSAVYTKIGDMVYASAILTGFSDRSTAATLLVRGLPFAPTISAPGGSMYSRYTAIAAPTPNIAVGDYVSFYANSSGNYVQLQHADLSASSSATVSFNVVYRA